MFHILIDCSQLSETYYNVLFGSLTERTTHISADVCGRRKSLLKPVTRQNIYRVVQFFHPRSSCTTTHISADVQRITLNASCMTISGERTEQLNIFCRVTGFTNDFLSFIDVELIRFFHGALQFNSLSDDHLHFFSHVRCEQIETDILSNSINRLVFCINVIVTVIQVKVLLR